LARREDQTLCHADIKAKTFRLSFRKYFACFASFRIFLVPKKGMGGGYYLIKEPKDINILKSFDTEGPYCFVALCKP
jgi:hypothetical protein